jgi:adenosine 3'-phospho 5'-phosphosulfate transporter B3
LLPSEKKPLPSDDVAVCGISLGYFSRSTQFIVCSLFIFLFFILYGYMQEWIFGYGDFKQFGWHLTLMQFFYYSIFGFIELQFKTDSERRIPLKTYILLAFLTVSTIGCSNVSLGFLNYPTQVIFKCCKLIPVMFGGIFIQNKRYTFLDFVAILLMTLGLIFFTIADQKVSPNFNPTGILLICLALCADAVIGNVQERTMKSYAASNCEVVLYSYSIGFVYILVGELASGQFYPAHDYFYHHPKIYIMSFIFSIFGYFGVLFVLSMVKSFGALLAVTVTTFRKALSIIMSFLLFTKPFTMQYVWSGLLVLFGITINIYSKNRDRVSFQVFSGRRTLCLTFVILEVLIIVALLLLTFATKYS